jgi:ABC-type Zn uptake system ZnuABC Zn-binding protein ZnuA
VSIRRWLWLVLALACGCRSEVTVPSGGIKVVATIQPLASLARELVGSDGSVRCLLPPGASPHTFEPLPRDVAELDGAALLVAVGAGLDDWSSRLLAGVGSPPRLITMLALPATKPLDWPSDDDDHTGNASRDPHAWLDPIRVRDALVPELTRALAELDPKNAEAYRARAATLTATLTELDASLRDTLAGIDARGFISYHDSWRYFAERYGLEQVASIETYAGDEPTAAELAALVHKAREKDVHAVIMEPQLGERVARNIATELGARIEMADPLGDPTDPARATYANAMRFNATAFARALRGAGQ